MSRTVCPSLLPTLVPTTPARGPVNRLDRQRHTHLCKPVAVKFLSEAVISLLTSAAILNFVLSSDIDLLLHVKTSHPTEAVSITQFTKAVARKAGKRKSGNINTCDICKVRERERKRVLDWRVCLTLKYCHFSGQFLSAQVV